MPPYPQMFLTEADAELTLHQNTEIACCRACTSLPRTSVQNSDSEGVYRTFQGANIQEA